MTFVDFTVVAIEYQSRIILGSQWLRWSCHTIFGDREFGNSAIRQMLCSKYCVPDGRVYAETLYRHGKFQGIGHDKLIERGAEFLLRSSNVLTIENADDAEIILINGGGSFNVYWFGALDAAIAYREKYNDALAISSIRLRVYAA